MIPKAPGNAKELARLIKRGEGPTLEFKRSTGELKEGMQTLCAFLNGAGGLLLFGVRPDGTIEGQQVSDPTLRDIAQAASRCEPSIHPILKRIKVKNGREVIAVAVESTSKFGPYTYDGRGYERVASTTQRMTQSSYEQLLLARSQDRYRWENAGARGLTPRDLDRDEAFRIVETARSAGRLLGPAPKNLIEVLDRLGVREEGRILHAAVVLCGKKFLPDYPQCELRMARFRGKDKAEFLDQKAVRAPAFKLLEEAEIFCQRHLPLPGKIVPGKLQRQDRPLIPPDAMREILVNALIHRDYSISGGCVALAIFDDRVEVWSHGSFLPGITPEKLTRKHPSVLRNPIIADAFNRAGLIERWGQGTNRVIEMCRKAGIAPPIFEEITGAALVTFKVPVGSTAQVTGDAGTKSAPSRHQVVILRLCRSERTLLELMKAVGRKDRSKFRNQLINPLLKAGLLELTVPDKPNSRLQRYRITKLESRQ